MRTFTLLNFGCRASQADGAALKRQLLEAGLAESPEAAQSDVAILNTCTVTAAADAEIRQTIRRIHRENDGCRILVTGCYAQRAPEEIAAIEGVAYVVGNSHKHKIPAILLGAPPGNATGKPARDSAISPSGASVQSGAGSGTALSPIWVGEIGTEFHFLPAYPDDRTRPTLKVQDGCNARCSFCIIPAVRGRSRSLPPGQAVEQIRELERGGYHEVVLSGINLGSYGRDLNRSITFLGLLERILGETRVARLRISSIEVMDVSLALIRLMATEPRLADHLHVPLQSGCDRVLRQMNRRYWTSQYAEKILAAREAMPQCGIGADVMAGFPGEAAPEHAESAQFIESLPFTYLHIFPYSPRPSTPAATRKDAINGRVAHERAAELRLLMAHKRDAFLATQLGRNIPALTLAEPGADAAVALSSNFLKIILPGCVLASNRLVRVLPSRLHRGQLYGFADEPQASSSGRLLPIKTEEEGCGSLAGPTPGNSPQSSMPTPAVSGNLNS